MYALYNDLITFVFTTFVVTLSVYLIKTYIAIKKLPRGPYGIPIFGYAFFITRQPHLKALELSKKYGPIFSVKLGRSNVVFLNDWQSVKDAFSKDELLGRPKELGRGIFRQEKNLLGESGPFWKEHRRFAFHVLRDLGFGKQVMESNIKDEITYFLKEIDKRIDAPINVHDLLTPSVSNNICYLVFGHRYDYDDPKRKHMDFLLSLFPRAVQVTTLIGLAPMLVKLIRIFGSSQIKALLKKLSEFEDIVDEEVKNHEKNLQENEVNDYIDGYLLEMKARKSKFNNVGTFTQDVLSSTARGFFGAGSETVRTTLDWLLKLIAVHDDVQKAVQQEIDSVIGSNRLPSWSDREMMPFTQAVILETQRWASVVALNIPRRTLADVTVSGHSIPKDTVVIANFWAVNRDPKLWKNPDEFDPYRFLTTDGKLQTHEALVPFSFGKRACVGETLAKFELFLYFTILMQKYNIQLPPGVEPSFESRLGLTLQPVQEPVLIFNQR